MSTSTRALAATGLGTVTVAGVQFDQLWMVGGAASLVVVGAILVRMGYRRDKTVSDR